MTLSAKGHTGTVNFDGAFVTISRNQLGGRLAVGRGDKRIPISSITATQWKPPSILSNGYLSFTLAGGTERNVRGTTQMVSDENTVIVTHKQAAEFQALREAIDHAITERLSR